MTFIQHGPINFKGPRRVMRVIHLLIFDYGSRSSETITPNGTLTGSPGYARGSSFRNDPRFLTGGAGGIDFFIKRQDLNYAAVEFQMTNHFQVPVSGGRRWSSRVTSHRTKTSPSPHETPVAEVCNGSTIISLR